jgi:glycosyltransferase involved in cell wall biosynthesis
LSVLLINYEYPPVGAGAATASQAIARSLVASGNPATVLTASFGSLVGLCDEEGIRVIRVPSRRRRRESATISEMVSFMRASTAQARRTVRAERIEAVIAFFSFPSGPAAWWAYRGTGVPYVVSLRGGDVPGAESSLGTVHRLLTPIRRRILRSARWVVANSAGLKAMSERADPVPVCLIPNGVDTRFFSPVEGDRRTGGPFRLLFVGRFQAQKNLSWMLAQLAEFRSFSSVPFTLDLVGDGPERPALSARVHELRLADLVRFHGWEDRSALRAHYQAADLIINPSLYEGMPNVVLEAMACGRPVLASRVPGNDATVVDRATGWLYASNDATDFRSALTSLISEPDLAAEFGKAARHRAVSEYSWDRCAQSYLDLLASPPPVSRNP